MSQAEMCVDDRPWGFCKIPDPQDWLRVTSFIISGLSSRMPLAAVPKDGQVAWKPVG